MTKKVKSVIFFLAAAIVVAALAFGGGMLFQNKAGSPKESTYTSDTIANKVKDISEYAVMDYRYTNVGKFENQLDFYGWDVPLTTKTFIISYDGSMKLGVEGDKIGIDVGSDKITISLPEIKVLSHEIYEDSIEVMDQSKNIFNQIEIEDYTGFANDRKKDMEEKIRNDEIYKEAQEKTKEQLRGFLSGLPGLTDQYAIVFATANNR